MYVYIYKCNTVHGASWFAVCQCWQLFFQSTISLTPKLTAHLHNVMGMAANNTVSHTSVTWKSLCESLSLQSCEVWRSKETILFTLHTINWWAAVGRSVGAVDIPDMAHWLALGNFCHYQKSCLLVMYFEYVCTHVSLFLVCSQNCEKWLLASSCLSTHLHGTTQIPLNGFSWNLTFEYLKVQVSLISNKNNWYIT